MEKELIINGVKYVKCEEPKLYKIYDLVKYNGYKWIVINVKGDKLTLMMKNCLPEEKVKKIFSEKYFPGKYLDESVYVLYNLDKKCNDWNKTEIKRGLNNEFLKEFDKEELVKMKSNYDEGKYSFDYIRIPKIREIEVLDLGKIKPNVSCWLMSPCYFDTTNGIALEWYMNSSGHLYNAWVEGSFGVRPVITLKSDNQKIEKVGTV